MWQLPGCRSHLRFSLGSLEGCVGRPPPNQGHRPRLICHLRGRGTLRRQAWVHCSESLLSCAACFGSWLRTPPGRQKEGTRDCPDGIAHPQQSRVSQIIYIPLGQVDSCRASSCLLISVREFSIQLQVCGGNARLFCLLCKRGRPEFVLVVDGGASSLASERHTPRRCQSSHVPRQSPAGTD